MKSVPHVTKSAASSFFGVTVQALDRWFSQGCPVAKRDKRGEIESLDLSAMAKWRLERARDSKQKGQQRNLDHESLTEVFEKHFKHGVCSFVVPALVHDFRADIERIAKFAGVAEEDAIRVWSIWALATYDTLHRMFKDPAIACNHSEYTRKELAAAGAVTKHAKKRKSANA